MTRERRSTSTSREDWAGSAVTQADKESAKYPTDWPLVTDQSNTQSVRHSEAGVIKKETRIRRRERKKKERKKEEIEKRRKLSGQADSMSKWVKELDARDMSSWVVLSLAKSDLIVTFSFLSLSLPLAYFDELRVYSDTKGHYEERMTGEAVVVDSRSQLTHTHKHIQTKYQDKSGTGQMDENWIIHSTISSWFFFFFFHFSYRLFRPFEPLVNLVYFSKFFSHFHLLNWKVTSIIKWKSTLKI